MAHLGVQEQIRVAGLERAAGRFLTGLAPNVWSLLDQALQDQVLGPLGGLQFGYNWQQGWWLAGLEADIQGAG